MLLDIRKIFTGVESPVNSDASLDLSLKDFSGYRIDKPVKTVLKSSFDGDVLKLTVSVTAKINAECARCLEPLEQTLDFTRDFDFRQSDLLCEEPEYPVTDDKKLDIAELVFQELLFEVPSVLLCGEQCQGLCSVCGTPKKQGCSCKIVATDERLAVLEKLLF